MNKTMMNLQDSFLNQVRKDGSEVKVVLLDGSQLSGYVRGFDNFTVVFHSHGMQHLIYKHAIAQVVSRKPMRKEGAVVRPREEEAGRAESAPPAPADDSAAKGPFNTIDLTPVKDP